jgi:nucleoside-diphosphate-sugar epimerase
MERILVVGALGQVGRELLQALNLKFGIENVISSDIRQSQDIENQQEILDILDKDGLANLVKREKITQVYNLAALLSATAEKNIKFAWQLSIDGLFNVLDLAKEGLIKKVFWPSSIAVFGPTTPKENTPQNTIVEPNTVYGIGKQAGEQWCNYYNQKFGVDVRSIRYPGLIGYKSLPGGGTTDYAVDIFYEALRKGSYECFLSENSTLPMMYMEDAIRATVSIMEAPKEQIKIRTSYNLAGFSFSPADLAVAIKKHIPDFEISYKPDFRNDIAATWPASIDDSRARQDWGWKPNFTIEGLVEIMLRELKTRI